MNVGRLKGPVHAPVPNLVLYLTEDCNMRCTYCFVEKKPRRMTLETARQAVDFLLHREISGTRDTVNITFFGGEPFLELDLMEDVIAYARQTRPDGWKTVTFGATTNGTVWSPRVERIVRGSGMGLLVSLDGDRDASRHRPMVSTRDSYDKVARNLPRLASCTSEMYVRMTFHPGSLDFVRSVQHALDLGAPSVALCPVVDNSWKGAEARVEAAYESLADWYIERARAGSLPPLLLTNQVLTQIHVTRNEGRRPARPCGIATDLLGVDPDGNVMPCHRFLYRPAEWLGSVANPVLSDERWKYVHLSSRDILGCDGCVAEPVCSGGCRVVALQGGYGLDQAHPFHCVLMRAHMRAAVRIYETLLDERNPVLERLVRSTRSMSPAMAELATR